MTKAELIQALAIYPDDTEIVLPAVDGYCSFSTIESIHKENFFYGNVMKEYKPNKTKWHTKAVTVIVLE